MIAELRDPAALATVRRDDDDVTIFKSVGHAVFDLAAARVLSAHLARARTEAL